MALITCNYFSEVLGLSSSMNVILPQQTSSQIGMTGAGGGQKFKTLYLLHGYSDDETIWCRRTSIERYVSELGIAVVMPNVHGSFYTDMAYGGAYWTFLTEELPAIARSFFPLSDAREDNFVAGLSMGGYGAFKWALRKPDQISAACSLSGALDIAAHAQELDGAIARAFKLIYGDDPVAGTDNDLLALLARYKSEDGAQSKPALFQSCGTEDFLYAGNVSFRDACAQTNLSLTYEEGPGSHNWEYWDEHIQRFLNWLVAEGFVRRP